MVVAGGDTPSARNEVNTGYMLSKVVDHGRQRSNRQLGVGFGLV